MLGYIMPLISFTRNCCNSMLGPGPILIHPEFMRGVQLCEVRRSSMKYTHGAPRSEREGVQFTVRVYVSLPCMMLCEVGDPCPQYGYIGF